jgi:hypothetical protein
MPARSMDWWSKQLQLLAERSQCGRHVEVMKQELAGIYSGSDTTSERGADTCNGKLLAADLVHAQKMACIAVTAVTLLAF